MESEMSAAELAELQKRVRLLEVEVAQQAAAIARLHMDMAAIAVERKLDLPRDGRPWPARPSIDLASSFLLRLGAGDRAAARTVSRIPRGCPDRFRKKLPRQRTCWDASF
jgi:hypothetical protein